MWHSRARSGAENGLLGRGGGGDAKVCVCVPMVTYGTV